MNATHTKLWLEYHAAVFPTFGQFFAGQSPQARQIQVACWNKALRSIELGDAKEATDRMGAGDVKRPFREEDHIAAIVEAARRIRSERRRASSPPRPGVTAGQQTFHCPDCRDEGYVLAWDPAALRRRARGQPHTLYRLAVLCTCAAGDWWAEHGHRGECPQRYDPERCLGVTRSAAGIPASGRDPEELARIDEWLANRPERMPGYEPAFAAYA